MQLRTTNRRLLPYLLAHFITISILISGALSNRALGQCTFLTELQFVNPSFEGPLGAHITPAPWSTCSITPDTQPGSWGVTLPPSEGNSYVGFVYGGPGWQEGASQQMNGNFIAGLNYVFTIDLAVTNSNQGGIVPGPAQLVIHGAHTLCGRVELLWTSPVITHTTWQTYTVSFIPTQDFAYVYFSIAPQSGNNRYILLDNITPIVPSAPFIDITSHQNGDSDGCSFDLSGTISAPNSDSIIIEGNFAESPLYATLNGLDWNAHITPTGTPVNINATLYFTDPILNTTSCSYDSVIINVALPTVNFTTNNVCQGTQASFTNQTIPNNTIPIVSYEWDFGDGNSASTVNATHTYASAGTYTVTLNATDNTGCTSSSNQIIIIYPLPQPSFDAENTCVGTPTPFTSTSTISSGTISAVAWDVNQDNNTDYTTSSGAHTYPSHGTQTIRLTVTSDFGCTATVTGTTEVYANPIIAISVNDNCELDTSIVVNTSSIDAGSYTSAWDIGADAAIEYTTQDLVHIFPVAGTYTVRLIVTSDFGCTDSSDFNIIVHARPNALFEVSPHCFGVQTAFNNLSTINPVDNNSITTFQWNFGDGGTSTLTDPTNVYGSWGTYPVSLIAISNHGCRDTFEYGHIVYPLPEPSFTFENNCLHEQSNFQNTTPTHPDEDGPNTYNWNFGDGTTGTAINPSHTYAHHGTYTVVLTTTSSFGCVQSSTNTIVIYPIPVAQFTATNLENCAPLCTDLINQSNVAQPSTIASSVWTINGSPLSNDSLSMCLENETHDPIYHTIGLTVTSNHGCKHSLVKQDYLAVYDLPLAQFSMSDPEVSIVHSYVEFTNESENADLYHWQFGQVGTSTLPNPSYLFPNEEEGLYHIILTARTTQGCVDTASMKLRVKEELIFYIPNTFTPDNDMHNQIFRPVLNAGYDRYDFNFYIYNRWGEMVFESHDDSIGWDGTYNGKLCPDGVYIWKMDVGARINEDRKQFSGHLNLLR